MGPLESWLFILSMAALMFMSFVGAGRALDWLIERLFTATDRRLWTDDKEES